ncbi:MAG TPA: hypothetical protein VK750_04530, partial [Cytophagaceae bacterium]|nr:hypothetical protein [Cytophagaceae bacterium]
MLSFYHGALLLQHLDNFNSLIVRSFFFISSLMLLISLPNVSAQQTAGDSLGRDKEGHVRKIQP